MKRRHYILTSLLVSAVLYGLLILSSPASAQEPTSTPGPSVTPTQRPGQIPPPDQPYLPICDRPTGLSSPGGTTINHGNISLTLPTGFGEFDVRPIPVTGGPSVVTICYIAGRSAIVIETQTGTERSREVTNPSANAVLDQILASVRLLGTPTPGQPHNTITAPGTGNGGLK